jgi:hypothetical protein
MGVVEKVVISDEALRRLEDDARRNGHTVAQEVARRVEVDTKRLSRDDLLAWSKRIRAMTPRDIPQTDSLTLLREDRDR